jgi:CubicO group peptidase (beta-lactamase class C family)
MEIRAHPRDPRSPHIQSALELPPLVQLMQPHTMTQKQSPLTAALQPFIDKGILAGAVLLVADRHKVLTLEATGYSDIAARTPMRTDQFFWIASVTKPITATAMMLLVDEGRVNLDDPVEKYLPEFVGQMLAVERTDDRVVLKKPARPFTVRQALNHTAGLPGGTRGQPTLDSVPLSVSSLAYALTPLEAEPGTRYAYTNAGFSIAGRIIEDVSGLPYPEFMDRRVFQPLGMKEITLWPNKAQLARMAKAYTTNAAKTALEELTIPYFQHPLDNRGRHASPGGGYFATASDLAPLAQMVLNGGVLAGKRFLSAAALRDMTTNQTAHLEQLYGTGWKTEKPPDPIVGHGGAYNNQLWVDPLNDLVLVYMIHHAAFPGEDAGKIYPAFRRAVLDVYGKH